MIHNEEKTMEDFDRFFQILQDEDPHQRLRGNHNWYYSEDHFYDHTKPWATHASLQTIEGVTQLEIAAKELAGLGERLKQNVSLTRR